MTILFSKPKTPQLQTQK